MLFRPSTAATSDASTQPRERDHPLAACSCKSDTEPTFVFTNGQTSGTATFTVSTPGLYVARAFINDSFDLAAESAPFTVSGP